MKLNTFLTEIQRFDKFSSQTTRVWLNVRTGEAFSANDDKNHSNGVFSNLEHFGLTQQDLAQAGYHPGESTYDYDGRILWAAIRKGWARIFINPRDPDWNSNIEGVSPYACRKALLWYTSVMGEPKKIVIVVRTGPGDRDGFGHVLTQDQIGQFVQTGKLMRDMVGESGRSKLGGETGINGFYYKGGQFLPSTDQPPGTWKVKIKGKNKLVGSSNELIEPGKFQNSPTPFSKSIFMLVRTIVDVDPNGYMSINNNLSPEALDYYGKDIRPGVKGILGSESYDASELIDLYNRGSRWVDVTPPNMEIVRGA